MIQAETQGLLRLFITFNLDVTRIPTLRPECSMFLEKFIETDRYGLFTKFATRFEQVFFFNLRHMRDEFMKSETASNLNLMKFTERFIYRFVLVFQRKHNCF